MRWNLRVGSADGPTWDVDLVPLAVRIEGDPAARPVALLALDGPDVRLAEVIAHGPTGADATAALIDARLSGAVPPSASLRVRHADVAHALAALGYAVEPRRRLTEVDAAAARLGAQLGLTLVPGRSDPETWTAWRLPPTLLEGVFAAAAAFFRAAAWDWVESAQVVRVGRGPAAPWTASVLGAAGAPRGVDVAHDERDLDPHLENTGAQSRSAVLRLTYHDERQLPEAMRAAIQEAGLPVAGVTAWPRLTVSGTPAGGLERAAAELLRDVLLALPGFVARHRAAFLGADGAQLPAEAAWQPPDGGTGLELRYDGLLDTAPKGPWDAPNVLSSGGPAGRGADLAASIGAEPAELRSEVRGLADTFARWLGDRGMAEDDVGWHVADGEFFLAFLAERGVPVCAVHELDLRLFLFDWLPRHGEELAADLGETLTSVMKVFDWAQDALDVHCPWAPPLLRGRGAVERRLSGVPVAEGLEQVGPDGLPRRENGGAAAAARESPRPSARGGRSGSTGATGAAWEESLLVDLRRRALVPGRPLVGGGAWSDVPGPIETRLARELQQRWLVWRERRIAAGSRHPSLVRSALARRQRQWEAEEHEGVGMAPAAAVRREQAALARGGEESR